MTVRLAAPHPLITSQTILPNPEWGDLEAYQATVDTKRTINNTQYTYVKVKDGRKRLSMRFRITQMKAIELKAFIEAYYLTPIQLTDHLDQRWIGWITTNPNEFETIGLWAGDTVGTGRTHVSIQLEFEGNLQ